MTMYYKICAGVGAFSLLVVAFFCIWIFAVSLRFQREMKKGMPSAAINLEETLPKSTPWIDESKAGARDTLNGLLPPSRTGEAIPPSVVFPPPTARPPRIPPQPKPPAIQPAPADPKLPRGVEPNGGTRNAF